MNDKPNQPMSRLKITGIYLLTYFIGILCVALPNLPVADMIAVSFPYGLFWLLVEPKEVNGNILLVVGYALYLILLTLGVALRSKIVYVIFVVLLILNIAGCYRGLS